jgi:hypothetical protein
MAGQSDGSGPKTDVAEVEGRPRVRQYVLRQPEF